jgi:tRNA/rRNA methyltransferase
MTDPADPAARKRGAPSRPPHAVLFGGAPPPAWLDRVHVVLVRPQGAANIGMIARAMKNFGLMRLRIAGTAPRLGDEARAHACHAADVLERAEAFPDLGAALADCGLVLGTSSPRPGLADRHELETPRTAAPRIRAAAEAGTRAAVVFGPEDHGLTTAELAPSHRVITIPAHPGYPVLNLAQSVMLVCYEVFQADAPGLIPPAWADRRELEAMEADLARTLMAIGFTNPGGVDRALTPLRRLFSRAGMTPRDARWVRGLARALRNTAARASVNKPGRHGGHEAKRG